jgi:hypothetical protein
MNDLTKEDILEAIALAVKSEIESHPLAPDEVVWVRMAIKAEADRAAFRKAVIDKTLTGLIVAALGAAGVYCLDYFTAHWIK